MKNSVIRRGTIQYFISFPDEVELFPTHNVYILINVVFVCFHCGTIWRINRRVKYLMFCNRKIYVLYNKIIHRCIFISSQI